MMEFLSDPIILLLILAAFCAGIIDSIAGGGGLITVPVLMLAGLAPVNALGTNKLQSLFGALSATIAYARAGQVEVKRHMNAAALAGAGGAGGAMVARHMPEDWLYWMLPPLLIGVAVYFAFKPNLDRHTGKARLSPFLFTCLIPPLIGFYDGIFGPGTGSFFMLAFVSLAGFGILKATAHTKLLNFASNIGGFAAFALVGAMNWRIGLVMGIAQFIGAQIGTHLALKIGAGLIKPLLIVICTLLAIKLMSETNMPWHFF